MFREDSLTCLKEISWHYQVFTTTSPMKIVRSRFMLNIRNKAKLWRNFLKKTMQLTYDFCFNIEILGMNKLRISINNLNVQDGVGVQAQLL